MESQGSVTEDLSVIVHTLLLVHDTQWVNHRFETKLLHHFLRRCVSSVFTVLVVNWVPRQHFNHSTSSILTTRSFSRVLTPSVVNSQVNRSRQPLSWLSVVSELSVQTLAVSSFYDTLLICVVQESTHRRVTVSLLDVQLVVVRQRCASCNILPVCIVQWLTVSIEVVSVSKPICRIQRPVKFVTL